MIYEIWDVGSGNLIATFDTEEEAHTALLERAEGHGWESLLRLALLREDAEGHTVLLATGRDLADIRVATTA
jgi:hypothetical protein